MEEYEGPLQERCKKIQKKRDILNKIKDIFIWILMFPIRVLISLLGMAIIVFCAICISPILIFIVGILGVVFVILIIALISAMILYLFSSKFREEVKKK